MNEQQVFQALIIVMFVSSVVTFLFLQFVTAPYGRHIRGGWGLTVSQRLGWVMMEAPAVFVIALCFVFGNISQTVISLIFIAMWELHYIHRSFIFPFLIRGGTAKRFPVVLIVMAVVFNTMNGYLNGRYLFHFVPHYPDGWVTDPRFIAGLLLFLGGFLINLHSDHVLRNLRKPGETGYKIPRGGLFEYVSSANYFGELMEWAGWAVATWSLPGLAFAVFTAANLMPSARAHHVWYRKQFPDYPKQRRALIPFVY